MSKVLRNCPFCGGEAIMKAPCGIEDSRRAIECDQCGNVIEYFDEKEAVECWNARDVRDAVHTVIDTVREAWYRE